jgi:DNA-binding response OmpR family regulator
MRILIVEDEAKMVAPVRRTLEREGYVVAACETGREALKLAARWRPDVVLLDLMLPDVDGRDVARELRRSSSVPIIMVTARGDESDRVAGLELGADDYVVKPFSLPELVARIRAVARRSAPAAASGEVLTFKDLRLDLERYRLFRDEEELALTSKELELLRILMSRPGALVRRDELVRAVWNVSLYESGKTLDVHISGLRRKLGDDARSPRYIETIRSIGFRLVEG